MKKDNSHECRISRPQRLAQFTTTVSRRPWAVLWIPIPTAWQIAARSVDANHAEAALALLLTIPELIGLVCIVAVFAQPPQM